MAISTYQKQTSHDATFSLWSRIKSNKQPASAIEALKIVSHTQGTLFPYGGPLVFCGFPLNGVCRALFSLKSVGSLGGYRPSYRSNDGLLHFLKGSDLSFSLPRVGAHGRTLGHLSVGGRGSKLKRNLVCFWFSPRSTYHAVLQSVALAYQKTLCSAIAKKPNKNMSKIVPTLLGRASRQTVNHIGYMLISLNIWL